MHRNMWWITDEIWSLKDFEDFVDDDDDDDDDDYEHKLVLILLSYINIY
jgi:hypothetical protein